MELYRLGAICTIEKGNTGITKALAGNYPMVTTAEQRITHNEYQFDGKAVIIPLVSSTGHGHASIKRLHYQEGKFALGSILCAIMPKDENQLNAKFLYKYLSHFKDKLLVPLMKGAANVSLSTSRIANVEIPVPTLEKQEFWINKFTAIDREFEELEGEIFEQGRLLNKFQQSILQDAIQGKLVPQDPNDEPASELLKKIKAEKEKLIKASKIKREKPLPSISEEEIPFELPKGWVWCRLGEIATLITKGSSPNWQGVNYVENPEKGILFITSKNVGNYDLIQKEKEYVEKKFNDIEPRSVLKKGDILTNIVGGSIGRTAIYNLDEIANINQAVCLIRFDIGLINKHFVLDFMNSSLGITQMFDKQFAPGRANLSMSDIANFYFPLPPLTEQERIVNKIKEVKLTISDLDQICKTNQVKAKQLMQAVLQEAFN